MTTTTKIIDTDVARKIWLAGVGAYGRMYSETQGAVEKLAHGANEAFDQLVAKGEDMEDKVRDAIAHSPRGEKVAAMMETASSRVSAFRKERRAVINARVDRVRKTVTETLAPLNVVTLGQAVEKLTVQVEALTKEVAALKKANAKAAKAAAAPKTVRAEKPAAAPAAEQA